MRLGESYKTEIYLKVSIIGHMKICFPVRRSKDLLEIQDCLRRAVKLVRSDRPSGFSFRRLAVDGNAILTPYCKATEYAEYFVSCDANYFITGKNR